MDQTEFKNALARDGFTEVLTREFPAGAVLPEHTHAWDARLMVLAGELSLDQDAGTQRLLPGDWCEVPCGALHAEHYGPAGTSLLVGRRYPSS